MSNRAQRRAKKQPTFMALSEQKKLERLFQNGITAKDLEEEYHNGFNKGYSLGRDNTLKMCYAALTLALKEATQLDRDGIINILRLTDSKITYALENEELMDEVFRDLGIVMQFDAVLDSRVQEA